MTQSHPWSRRTKWKESRQSEPTHTGQFLTYWRWTVKVTLTSSWSSSWRTKKSRRSTCPEAPRIQALQSARIAIIIHATSSTIELTGRASMPKPSKSWKRSRTEYKRWNKPLKRERKRQRSSKSSYRCSMKSQSAFNQARRRLLTAKKKRKLWINPQCDSYQLSQTQWPINACQRSHSLSTVRLRSKVGVVSNLRLSLESREILKIRFFTLLTLANKIQVYFQKMSLQSRPMSQVVDLRSIKASIVFALASWASVVSSFYSQSWIFWPYCAYLAFLRLLCALEEDCSITSIAS